MSTYLGVGWHFPVKRSDKEGEIQPFFALSAHEESIKQAIWIILATAKGERVMRPDFGCGIYELVFAPNDATTRAMAQHHVREALIRWEHEDFGWVSPATFIPIAEESGLILTLGRWVLETACCEALSWSGAAAEAVVAVNVSPQQFAHDDIVAQVRSVLALTGLPPQRLEL